MLKSIRTKAFGLVASAIAAWPTNEGAIFASIPITIAQAFQRPQHDFTQRTISAESSLTFIKTPESERSSSLDQDVFEKLKFYSRKYDDSSDFLNYAVNLSSFTFDSLSFSSNAIELFLTNTVTFVPVSLDLVSKQTEIPALPTRNFAPIPPLKTKLVFNLKPKPSKNLKSPSLLPIEDTKVIQPNIKVHQQDKKSAVKKADNPAILSNEDKTAARTAWQYFNLNWNQNTGLVNAVENYPWTTWWDQGSAVLGTHAARQLNLITPEDFNSRITRLLETLETLPLAPTGLPNKAYSTATATMRTLGNAPDPLGTSGWSVLDLARFLLSLDILRTHYPEYRPQINQIVKKWKLTRLVEKGWLQGGVIERGKVFRVQEGRLGYEQYAAHSLKLWNINASNALSGPPTVSIKLEGITLNVDHRNFKNSGASNPLTNDPYLMWGLELGWPQEIKPQVANLLAVQRKRYERTKILTAVNEDSLDRFPYFIYGSVYADGQSWSTKDASSKSIEKMNHLSLKAAFAWSALMPDDPYANTLRTKVHHLADKNRGYFTGVYENPTLGVNTVCNVNTNAVVLESIFYKARKNKALALP